MFNITTREIDIINYAEVLRESIPTKGRKLYLQHQRLWSNR